jgi:hypothetical protein
VTSHDAAVILIPTLTTKILIPVHEAKTRIVIQEESVIETETGTEIEIEAKTECLRTRLNLATGAAKTIHMGTRHHVGPILATMGMMIVHGDAKTTTTIAATSQTATEVVGGVDTMTDMTILDAVTIVPVAGMMTTTEAINLIATGDPSMTIHVTDDATTMTGTETETEIAVVDAAEGIGIAIEIVMPETSRETEIGIGIGGTRKEAAVWT